MSFKALFSKCLKADPDRLHFAAHSHHLWPDASYQGQLDAWTDAALLADRKWDKIMGEVWPEAQGHVARELGTDLPEAIVFAPNTHDFILRIVSACPRRGPVLRVLTSDGEFHSARRQFARWAEDGWFSEEQVSAEPFDTFTERFLDRAASGDHDLIFVSQVLFSSGRLFEDIEALAALARPEGPWVAVDGYHAFMALPSPFSGRASKNAFYLGGGYKYAMAGEGCAFLHAPSGYGPRPAVTGWFAEFDDLSLSPGSIGYAPDAGRFLGATFDPSGLYRFKAVRRMLHENGLTTAKISAHAAALQAQFLTSIGGTVFAEADLLNPPTEGDHARYLAFRDLRAQAWEQALNARNCITDVRGDVLRIGFAIYQDEQDVDRLVSLAEGLS